MRFALQSSSLVVDAPAKINLSLQVLARRPDGYHEIESVMGLIGLYDRLVMNDSTTEGVTLVVRSALGSLAETIPSGPENLVVKAANLLKQVTGCNRSVRIELFKRIPSAAGLGGGSSDAAATLAGLNLLWKCGLTRRELQQLGEQLGSDVPVFLAESPVSFCRGRGEKIEPVQEVASGWVVVARGASGLSTAEVYRHCVPNGAGSWSRELISAWKDHSVGGAGSKLRNGLQEPAIVLNGELTEMSLRFQRIPMLGNQMSGSGTAWFGICHSRRHAECCAQQLRAMGATWTTAAKLGL